MTRMALSAALGAALALAAGSSPASAAPLAIVSSAAVVQSTARGEDSVAVSRPLTAELARQEIFEILCGGVLPEDSALAEHLWQVAGSLARRAWTPPRVTVRSVVSASEASRR